MRVTSGALPNALPAGAERLPAAAGFARFPILPKPSQIFPILSRGKQVFALRCYIVCCCTPHTRAVRLMAAFVRSIGKVWEELGVFGCIAANWCDSVRVTSRALPGVLPAETERLPAAAGFARFPILPKPSQIFPILSRGKQVFALRCYIVCRCTPHTRAIV